MSNIEAGTQNKKEIKALYPQRAFEDVDQMVDEIQKIILGEEPKIKLSETEEGNLLDFERALRIEFENIYKLSINSTTLYLDYFATKEGQQLLWEKTGLELTSDNPIWIRDFIFSHSEHIAKIGSAARNKISGETLACKNRTLLDQIAETADANGDISVQDIPIPQKIGILLNPVKAKDKIEGLRSFKQSLKEKYDAIGRQTSDSLDFKKAQKDFLDIYRRRANILIMDLFPYALLVDQKKQSVGDHNLSRDEREFLAHFEGLTSPGKNRSRLDKLIYGASKEYDEKGWKHQTPGSLMPYVEKIAKLGEEVEIHKEELIRAKGLDPEKIIGEQIDIETRSNIGEEILASYDKLSSQPRIDYRPERTGRAPDGKWQIVNLPSRSTFGVVESKGAVLGPEKIPYSVADTFETLGHEIEGHVLQSENKKLMDLEYFQKLGKDSRAAILSEGGAMYVQDRISTEAFGYPTIPHPHYIRAMQKKLEGGNYLDCTKAFYDSRMLAIKRKRNEGALDDAAFKKEISESVRAALNRAERLFGMGTDLASQEKHLTHSKDTAYLEQYILTEKLKETGLEKLLFLGSGNLQDIITLLRLDKLDLSKIQTPKYQALKIWKRERNKYLL
jgi:hypothetical protein